MASLPQPNPIDLGLLNRGAPIDHVRTSSEYCFLCGTHTQQHLFKLIASYHLGFGAPAIVRLFSNRSTTKGKTGRRQHYSVCTVCTAAWAADERTHQMLVDEHFSGGSAAERAYHEMITTLGCAMASPSEALVEAWLDRVESEFARVHPERWAQLESKQNAALIDATLSVVEDNSGTAFTPLERGNANSDFMGALTDQAINDERKTQGHSSDWMQQLKEIGQLRDDGLLTEDEFQAEKARILQDKGQGMSTWVAQIRELGELREAGLLTDQEFEEQKKLLLPSSVPDERATTTSPPPHLAAHQIQHQLPKGLAFDAEDETARRKRHSELGGGKFGRYEGWGGGHWVCHAHRKSRCHNCIAADRSSRGRYLMGYSDRWRCHAHAKENCRECSEPRG